MKDSSSTKEQNGKTHRTEIIVAVIGLVSVLGGALIANWDSLISSKTSASPPPEATPTVGSVATSTALPSFVTCDSVDTLRNMNKVRPIKPLEEDKPIKQLANGVYGFTVPWSLKSDGLSLGGRKGGTAIVEVHKSSQGTIFALAYVSETDLIALLDPTRKEPIATTIFFQPYKGYDQLIGIPLERIRKCDHRDISGAGAIADVTIL